MATRTALVTCSLTIERICTIPTTEGGPGRVDSELDED